MASLNVCTICSYPTLLSAYEDTYGWRYRDRTWIKILTGIRIFILKSRLIQWIISTYLLILSVLLLYRPDNFSLLASAFVILAPVCLAHTLAIVIALGKIMNVKDNVQRGRSYETELIRKMQQSNSSKEAIMMSLQATRNQSIATDCDRLSKRVALSTRYSAAPSPPFASERQSSISSPTSAPRPKQACLSVFPWNALFEDTVGNRNSAAMPAKTPSPSTLPIGRSPIVAGNDLNDNVVNVLHSYRPSPETSNRTFANPPTPEFYQASPVPCAIPVDGRAQLKPIARRESSHFSDQNLFPRKFDPTTKAP